MLNATASTTRRMGNEEYHWRNLGGNLSVQRASALWMHQRLPHLYHSVQLCRFLLVQECLKVNCITDRCLIISILKLKCVALHNVKYVV